MLLLPYLDKGIVPEKVHIIFLVDNSQLCLVMIVYSIHALITSAWINFCIQQLYSIYGMGVYT